MWGVAKLQNYILKVHVRNSPRVVYVSIYVQNDQGTTCKSVIYSRRKRNQYTRVRVGLTKGRIYSDLNLGTSHLHSLIKVWRVCPKPNLRPFSHVAAYETRFGEKKRA